MSWDDKYFMSIGKRVRHKYKRGRSNTKTCELCGCKRKRVSSGYKYQVVITKGFDGRKLRKPSVQPWSNNNPPCVDKNPDADEDNED